MESIIYSSIFIIGIVFGSFFTLAVYRLPRKENITYVRSHCTNCNHKLGFWDLIPVFSYIFLGGKCKYCGEKIRIRYLLLEVFSGLVFLLVAITHGLTSIMDLCFIYLFMAGMFIIAGIDKENYIIPNNVCIYELIIAIFYFIYKIIIKSSIVENIIGLIIIPVLFLIIDLLIYYLVKDKEKMPIGFGDIKYISLIGLMFGFPIQILSIIFSTIITFFGMLIHKYKDIPWGYYLTISTIIIVALEPYMNNLIDLIKIRS